jgi:hypothetical protein
MIGSGTLACEQAVPVVSAPAQLLQGGHVGEARDPLRPHRAERAQRAGARLRAADRRMGSEQRGVVAEHSGERRPAAGGRQMAHLGAGGLEHDLDREMRGAVEPAGRVDDLAWPLPGVVDELLHRSPGLARVDERIDGSADRGAMGGC